ncbi:MAG: hypothetical protein ABIZ80_01880, partial [Bryobacteraceae bacterium]
NLRNLPCSTPVGSHVANLSSTRLAGGDTHGYAMMDEFPLSPGSVLAQARCTARLPGLSSKV